MIDGKTLWGLIDEKGDEIIPCIYPNLATHSGTAVNFQRTKYGNYGIMDFDGNVIMEPRYDEIYEYDKKHGLIAFFVDWDEGHQVGVARVSDGNVIIPNKYGYIGFEDDYIECEKDFADESGSLYDYYDYDGNQLKDNIYFHKWEFDGGYGIWNAEHKCGAVDKNNNTIVPFIFDDSSHIYYYLQGYIVTGSKGKYGLTTKDGKRLLEDCYSAITIQDEFIIAEKRKQGNWDYSAELYLKDGTKLFEDISRDIHIRDNTIVRDMPFGKEYYQIIR